MSRIATPGKELQTHSDSPWRSYRERLPRPRKPLNNVRIIEKHKNRADYLSQNLDNTIVWHGSAFGPRKLADRENIEGGRYFLAR